MTLKLPSPLKTHGGKKYLVRRIVELMPPHRNYVEPFAGGLAVLLAKDSDGVSEIVNDLDGGLTNFWHVIQKLETFEHFQRYVEAIPFSEVEWRDAGRPDPLAQPWERAVKFFIRDRQSLAGRKDTFALLTHGRLRRGMNEQASAWWSAVDGLDAVHRRLGRVLILNRPALEVIHQRDKPDTLFYCDPPYHPDTRRAAEAYGQFEMTADDHIDLLAALQRVKANVMLSGYRCPLYDQELVNWRRVDFDLPNNAAGGKSKRRMTESIWMNWR
jgi:DNA adenine methylase